MVNDNDRKRIPLPSPGTAILDWVPPDRIVRFLEIWPPLYRIPQDLTILETLAELTMQIIHILFEDRV